ncbi:MAG: 4-(cytidine 5'-diphospho)-2-C-methyl-D-erythritol kinase [Planctomycetaceae bacterium]|nr:4-(cytidine 5'-diphospho)-2-C-methyl-D-erythritol kinase [Planctomycetaceae bacterium]
MFTVKHREIWTVFAPAKLNLFFEVLGKRPDGFHEIVSVAVPVRLFDTLTFRESDTIRLTVHGGGTDIPTDERNIVVKALRKIQDAAGYSGGAAIRLFKRIPSQAGLGGGSSDAAAALQLARRAWKLKITDDELCRIAADVGSDCPLFFYNTATSGTGRGEIIQPLKLLNRQLHFVIVKPPEGLSTAEVYKNCMLLHGGQFRSAEKFLTEWNSGNVERIGNALFNRLEVPARHLWHRFDEVRAMFDGLDCLAVQMSGSGTAFFGLCRSKRHARFVVKELRRRSKSKDFIAAVESVP